jgi:hypothetical protein
MDKSGRMRWAVCVASMRRKRSVFRIMIETEE